MHGVLVGFSPFRERTYKSAVRECTLCFQHWVTVGLVLESVKHCVMSACETGRTHLLEEGLGFKTLCPDEQGCTETV